MTRRFYNPILLNERVEKIIRESEFLGNGNNGVVYRIDEHTIIKIFNEPEVCKTEYDILTRSQHSASFPKVYELGEYYIIRDFIGGVRMDKYLNRNLMNEKLCESLFGLIKEFKNLGYTKVDIRCKDLYVQKDFSVKVIDPKDNYSRIMSYPRHLMKGIDKRKSLNIFLKYIETIDPSLSESWGSQYQVYKEHYTKKWLFILYNKRKFGRINTRCTLRV